MTSSTASVRGGGRGAGARRAGYVGSAGANVLLLLLVNTWPGWDAVPVLTEDTPQVLGLVNLSLTVGLLANLVYLLHDPPWLRYVGDLVTTSVGLAAMVRVWQVFPLDVSEGWRLVAHLLLAIGVFGSVVAIVVALVRLVRLAL